MDQESVKQAVRDVFEEERTSFWVPAEAHYNDHRFIVGLRKVLMVIGTVVISVIVPICLYILFSYGVARACNNIKNLL